MRKVVSKNGSYYNNGIEANNESVVDIYSIALVGPGTAVERRSSDCDSAKENKDKQSPLKWLIVLIRIAVHQVLKGSTTTQIHSNPVHLVFATALTPIFKLRNTTSFILANNLALHKAVLAHNALDCNSFAHYPIRLMSSVIKDKERRDYTG